MYEWRLGAEQASALLALAGFYAVLKGSTLSEVYTRLVCYVLLEWMSCRTALCRSISQESRTATPSPTTNQPFDTVPFARNNYQFVLKAKSLEDGIMNRVLSPVIVVC